MRARACPTTSWTSRAISVRRAASRAACRCPSSSRRAADSAWRARASAARASASTTRLAASSWCCLSDLPRPQEMADTHMGMAKFVSRLWR